MIDSSPFPVPVSPSRRGDEGDESENSRGMATGGDHAESARIQSVLASSEVLDRIGSPIQLERRSGLSRPFGNWRKAACHPVHAPRVPRARSPGLQEGDVETHLLRDRAQDDGPQPRIGRSGGVHDLDASRCAY